jgi:hypothetical protein
MAVISTLLDPAVLLYTGVVLLLTLGIGVAHLVALSADNPNFSSIIVSWENLFAMSACRLALCFSPTVIFTSTPFRSDPVICSLCAAVPDL